jgi:type I restriction enzyme S subunit
VTWKVVELRRVARVTLGQSPPGETYNSCEVGLPFFQGKAEFGEEHPVATKWCTAPSRVAKPGDVLLSVRAPVGPTNVAVEQCCIGRGLAAIRAKEKVLDQRYLLHILRFKGQDLARRAQGSTFDAVGRADVEQIAIPLPTLSEQRRIVEILDQANRLRRLRAQADAKADRILPALFVKMFGDPMSNPKRWPTHPISRLAVVTTGNTPPRARLDHFGHHIEWIKSDNLNTRSHYLTPAVEWLSESGRQVGRIAGVGSTLVTCIAGSPGAIGNAALANREVAFNQQINAATPMDGVDPYFLYAHFLVGKRLIQAASSGGMKGIVTKVRFSEVRFLSPPSELQKRFGKQCKELCDQNEARIRQGDRLHQLFSVLCDLAFHGDLTALWREAHMKELLREMEHQAEALGVPGRAEIAQ